VSQQFSCEHCDRPLITIEPTRFVTHGAVSIRTSVLEHRSFVECPACGHETRLDLHRFGVQLS
jgi:hypothetical protein